MGDYLKGVGKVFTIKDSENATGKELRGAVVVYSLAAIVGASMFTRKRVSDGKDPIAGVLF